MPQSELVFLSWLYEFYQIKFNVAAPATLFLLFQNQTGILLIVVHLFCFKY